MRSFLFFTLLALPLFFVQAEEDRLSAPLLPDPAARMGKLANGLTWYIQKNAKPEKRVELRLVVRAGSTLEDDDQQGFAHLLEHMAFNGSRHFKQQEMVNFLEALGVAFGPDLNAYTAFDQTVYLLQIPTHDPKNLEQGFLILEDWAQGLNLEDAVINKERLVIQEEWRRGRGAEERIRDAQFPVLFHNSRYAVRLPIGQMDVIANSPAQRVRDFYKDWYRPDLMSVIVVGDIDPDAIQKLVEKHFSALKMPENPRERQTFALPSHAETLTAIVDDTEATETSVSFYHKMPPEGLRTVGDYRRRMLAELVTSMLNQRFDEISRQPTPPFIAAYAWKGSFIQSTEFFGAGAQAEEGGAATALRGLATELERVRRHGFTATELERTKKTQMRAMRSKWQNRNDQSSRDLATEWIQVVTDDSVHPGVDAELKLYEEFLEGITLEETTQAAAQWLHPTNRVLLADGPKKTGVSLPSREEALAILDEAVKADLAAWEDKGGSEELMKLPESPGTVTSTEEIPELGITIATLSNGIQLWLKPTDFKRDEVLLTAFSKGGLSLSPEDSFVSSANASAIVGLSGLADFDAITLQKTLAGRKAAVEPFIDTYYEGLRGGASPEDLETLFQLIHLHFSSPRGDEQAVQTLSRHLTASLENRLSSPEAWLEDRTAQVLRKNHPLYRSMRLEEVGQIHHEAALRFFKERFADADDFIFILAGHFDVKQVLDLATTYLGSLPAQAGQENWKDPGVRYPARRMLQIVEKGIAPRAHVRMIYSGPTPGWDPIVRNRMQSLAMALDIHLREIIREQLGGTYDIYSYCDFEAEPTPEYAFHIEFGCDPARINELITSVRKVVAEAREKDLPKDILTKVREKQIRQREANVKTNKFWVQFLQYSLQVHQDPRTILTYEKMVRSLKARELRKLAQTMLPDERETTVILRPEAPFQSYTP